MTGPTGRSSISGKEIAPTDSAATAKRNPVPIPTTIIVRPASVMNTSRTNAAVDCGACWPSVAR